MSYGPDSPRQAYSKSNAIGFSWFHTDIRPVWTKIFDFKKCREPVISKSGFRCYIANIADRKYQPPHVSLVPTGMVCLICLSTGLSTSFHHLKLSFPVPVQHRSLQFVLHFAATSVIYCFWLLASCNISSIQGSHSRKEILRLFLDHVKRYSKYIFTSL